MKRTQTRRSSDNTNWEVIADTGPLAATTTTTTTTTSTTAKIVPSSTSAVPGQTVTLDGTQSVGDGLIYKWTQPKGTTVVLTPTATAPVVSFVANDNTNQGRSIQHVLGFELSVKDLAGAQSVDKVDIVVVAPQEPTTAPPPAEPPAQTHTTAAPAPSSPPAKFTADVMNFSTKITTEELQNAICPAIQKQMDNEHATYWGQTANFNFSQPVKGNVKLGIFDNSRQPDALGWHDAHGPVVTIAIFYVGTYEDLCITISHEMLETIVDTNAVTTVPGVDESGTPCTYYLEDCDAVESDRYLIDGISVSDFVTPAWFGLAPPAGATPPDMRTDFLETTKKAFDIAPGGYMPVSYDGAIGVGQTWTQTNDRTSGLDNFSGARARMRQQHQAKLKKEKPKKEKKKGGTKRKHWQSSS